MTSPAARAAPDPAELDFYSFIALAKRTLAEEYGFRHQRATEVLLTLIRVSDLITYDLEAVVHRPRGRSWSAFRLLFVVWLAGPMESKTAARLTGMSRAAVSNLTKTLVGDGLLARTPDARDGRSVRLSLTPAGHAEMVDVFHAQNEREQHWASVLSEDEQRTLVALLEKLITGGKRFDARGRR